MPPGKPLARPAIAGRKASTSRRDASGSPASAPITRSRSSRGVSRSRMPTEAMRQAVAAEIVGTTVPPVVGPDRFLQLGSEPRRLIEVVAPAPTAEEVVMSSIAGTATEIRPFQIEIPEERIDDLRRRIEATRWPSKELVDDRSQGVQLATLKALAEYWATDYDFGRIEARLNALPQFTTEIDGVEIHFIHVRSQHEDALPLIMTHGWPGSVIELLETVGPLTDPSAHGGTPEDAFHLVLPSLPGYGFSGEPTELGWDSGRIARAWAERVGGADGPPRLHALRRPGGRRGRRRHGRDGPPGARGAARHPPQRAPRGGRSPGPTAGGVRAGTRGARRAHHVLDGWPGHRPGAVHPAADDRLLPAGFTRRAGGLDARPRHGQLLQDLPRLR